MIKLIPFWHKVFRGMQLIFLVATQNSKAMLFLRYLFFVAIFILIKSFSFQAHCQNNSKIKKIIQTKDACKHFQVKFAQYDTLELFADIYQPQQADELKKYPLLIIIHGGGFMSGSRENMRIVKFCNNFAKRNYICAAFDYRLHLKGKKFDCKQPVSNKVTALKKAVEDTNLFIDYIISTQKLFKIDTSKIIILGSSAGAYVALHTVFNNKNTKQNISGLVSMAGAITDTSLITEQNKIPVLLFHGTTDKLVPYSDNYHHYCDKNSPGAWYLYGSESIAKRFNTIGGSYILYSFPNAQHEISIIPFSKHRDAIDKFIRNVIINKKSINKIIHCENQQ